MHIGLLAVGISQYSSAAIQNLTVCDHDAQMVAAAFHHIAGDTFQQRVLLNEQATKQGIKEGIAWLAQAVEPDGLAIFYYSGHGASYPDDTADENDGNDEFLCPHDCGMDPGLATFIRDDELRTWLRAVTKRTNHLVIMLDSCHSGTAIMAPQSAIAKEVPLEVVRAIMGDAKPAKHKKGDASVRGEVLLAGCRDDELSYIINGAPHSVFTTHILNSLQDSTIATFQTLYTHVVSQIAAQLEPLGLQQHPNLVDGTSGAITFR